MLCLYLLRCRSLVVSADEEDPTEFSPPADVRITNVALGADLEDENGRTSLKLIFPTQGERDSDDEEEEEEDDDDDDDDLPLSTTVLCSLTPGKVRHAHLGGIFVGSLLIIRLSKPLLTWLLRRTTWCSSKLLERSTFTHSSSTCSCSMCVLAHSTLQETTSVSVRFSLSRINALTMRRHSTTCPG